MYRFSDVIGVNDIIWQPNAVTKDHLGSTWIKILSTFKFSMNLWWLEGRCWNEILWLHSQKICSSLFETSKSVSSWGDIHVVLA